MEPRPLRDKPSILTTIFNLDLSLQSGVLFLKNKREREGKRTPSVSEKARAEAAEGTEGPDHRLVWTLFIDQVALTAITCMRIISITMHRRLRLATE